MKSSKKKKKLTQGIGCDDWRVYQLVADIYVRLDPIADGWSMHIRCLR